ncbi:hypothetical protein, partial [Pseudomonas kitaguniensis]|uniref:hypothetical protein n=1 Tax=Pseudomonas kitaguniensis TaxID=2607908 RepID=UPI0019D69197
MPDGPRCLHREQAPQKALLICFNHSGRLSGRRAFASDLDLDLRSAPLNHDGRTQASGSIK